MSVWSAGMVTNNGIDSVICGASYVLGSKLIYGDSIGMNSKTGKMFLESGIAEFFSDSITGMVLPSVVSMAPALSSLSIELGKPVISGISLVLLDYFMKSGGSSSNLYKFVLQTGSSVLSHAVDAPIRVALGI